MISPKDRDMNRSRDVKGPELKRPYDQEMKPMKEMKDSSPTGTLSKHGLSELHDGDHHAPLTALGKQEVVQSSPMGRDMGDHKPSLSKGGLKDAAHAGGGSRMAKGSGRSIAKELEYKAKKKM